MSREEKRNFVLTLLVGVVGLTVLLLLAGPRTVAKEVRRQVAPRAPIAIQVLEEQIDLSEVKTATTRAGRVLSGTLVMQNQRTPDNGPEGPGPSVVVAVNYPPAQAFIARVYRDPSTGQWGFFAGSGQWQWGFPDPQLSENEHLYAVGLEGLQQPGEPLPSSHYAFVKTTGASVSADFSLSGGGDRLSRERTHSPAPGRDSSPVYAVETKAKDTWHNDEHPYAFDATCGSIHLSGVQEWNETYGWVPDWTPGSPVQIRFSMAGGAEGTDYASASLQLDGQKLDFSHRHKTIQIFTLRGGVGELVLRCDDTSGVTGLPTFDVEYVLPYMIDFRQVFARDRQGTAVDGVRLDGPFQASPRIPESMNWSTTP